MGQFSGELWVVMMGYNGVSNGKAVTWQGKEFDGWVAVFIIPNMRSKMSATGLHQKTMMIRRVWLTKSRSRIFSLTTSTNKAPQYGQRRFLMKQNLGPRFVANIRVMRRLRGSPLIKMKVPQLVRLR